MYKCINQESFPVPVPVPVPVPIPVPVPVPSLLLFSDMTVCRCRVCKTELHHHLLKKHFKVGQLYTYISLL